VSASESRSARAIAAQVLREFASTRAYAERILGRLLDQTVETQRATDLVYGTLRNLNALDTVIARFSGRQTARIDSALLSFLRIGVYELVYNPATPAYSIVNEAVSNVDTAGGRRQTGFVNAVLRQIGRHITDRQIKLSCANPGCTLVQTPETGCQFDTDFLPDRTTSLPEYLSTCFSLRPWLVDEWLEQFGPERASAICLASNRRPSLYVRVNPLRTTLEELLATFEHAGIRAEAVPSAAGGARPAACPNGEEPTVAAAPPGGSFKAEDPGDGPAHTALAHRQAALDAATRASDMIRIVGPHAVTQLPGFADGLFTVQDLSASRAVQVLAPQPAWSILDLCSAPGTKTTQLAEATHDSAHITATDINPGRLDRVRENLARLGIKSVTVVPYAQVQAGQTGPFDAIVLDAPCSNTGVLARRVEARFRVRRKVVQEIAATQKALLAQAAGLVKPGGHICYSTCSIQRQENQDVREFLTESRQLELTGEELILPSAKPFDHDGAYVALLTRRG
jgi:16S rRNA (cytosine967-C5)-methyltransferase